MIDKLSVCMVTSGHARYDVRIFNKECKSLVKLGYDVTLVVNDELDNEIKDGVNILSTNFKPKNRFERLFFSKRKIKKIVKNVNADVFHLHDSELLQMVKHLKKKGKIVIFDSHEDYLYAIDDKEWIPKIFKKLIKRFYKIYEKKVISKTDAAIVCYHWTEKRFSEYCEKVKMVLNFPIIKDEVLPPINFNNRSIGFAGLISEMWCHKEIIKACNSLGNVRYELAGKLRGRYGDELKLMDGWSNVNYHGYLPSDKVYEKVYNKSSVGVALLDYISLCDGDVGNLSNTKIFEIMYSGLPLLCTDFSLWREIIDTEKCGVYVNPHDLEAVTNAVKTLLENPGQSRKMGLNGRAAVIKKYNWSECEKELYDVYNFISELKRRRNYD